MNVEPDSLLTHSPEVRHDRVRIAGTGITVHRIAVLMNPGHSPVEIVRKYKHLTLAGVHAALAYYHANREQIDAEVAADREKYSSTRSRRCVVISAKARRTHRPPRTGR